jgi:hypothetical protein
MLMLLLISRFQQTLGFNFKPDRQSNSKTKNTNNLGYIEDKQLADAFQSPQLHKQTKVVVSSVLSQMLQEAEN